jgi:hypothetical protein
MGHFIFEGTDEYGKNLTKETILVDLITISHKDNIGWMCVFPLNIHILGCDADYV